eukprot:CAMPEP_0117024404 /NCGR_PEP_ID=MMETSP0472-20121206/18132_1 /TAXON_ID=693140 ORGANISM="Tiarina fusus, Strain LIS" /NCGR_SAMPLE_ID=MMETSP0472 /ASSEMBLY_ACC=CAM_ASM_000603 /LENGTH=292 /DNA_ID=CAMNT_0004730835 /DNA_START=36 /DNA_END=914 /DNA_ORIENTATION=+
MTSLDTQHTDMIHDVQVDFYGKRMATASSDRTIKIFSIENRSHTPLAELRGHDGPVWQVAWAHPKHGNILASCGYDRKVIIWQENASGWSITHTYEKHELSVNSIAWAPQEQGLCLACASSDTFVSILSFKENNWTEQKFAAHKFGVSSVSWCDSGNRFVTGGCDKTVKVWSSKDGKWECTTLEAHQGWVRDVAWAPNIGLPYETIASCSQDGSVMIWRENKNQEWEKTEMKESGAVAWRVSWSTTGNILAVTSGDNKVTLYTESLNKEGEWKPISQMDEAGSLAFSGEQMS